MGDYTVVQTNYSPKVNLKDNGEFSIEGVSLSENSQAFFEPMIKWANDYCEKPANKTHVNLNLEYLDSGSLGYFNRFLETLDNLHKSGKSVVNVTWCFEEDDQDMEDYGKDIEQMFAFNIDLKSI